MQGRFHAEDARNYPPILAARWFDAPNAIMNFLFLKAQLAPSRLLAGGNLPVAITSSKKDLISEALNF